LPFHSPLRRGPITAGPRVDAPSRPYAAGQFLRNNRQLTHRSLLLRLACGVAIASSLAGCDKKPSAASDATVTEAVASLPTSFAYDKGDFSYAGFEFQINTNAGLVQNPYAKTASGDLQQDFFHFTGALAESYEVSPDGLTYIFHLHKGVLSPAGHELTADDVLWTYDRKWHSTSVAPFISYPAIIDPAKQFTKLGKYDVSIKIDRAGDGFTLLALLAHVSGDIYDSTLLKVHTTTDDPYAVKWSAAHGNFGFGAYTLASFTPGQQLVLVANPHYYAGEPKVKKIIQQLVPDAGTRANLVRNKDVDIATALLPADVAAFSGTSGVRVFTVNPVSYVRLELNTLSEPFKNVALRRALRYAIPYDQIVKEVYKGRAIIQKGYINPRYPGATDEGLEANVYDPDKVRQMLKDAGYTLPVAFTITLPNAFPDLQQAAVRIQSAASAAGIAITLRTMPMAGAQQAFGTGNFQAYLIAQQSISQSPAYELMLQFTKGSPLNNTGWLSDEYNAAVAKGVAVGDPLTPEAGKWWNQAQQIWWQAAPMLPIAFIQPNTAFGPRVQGYADRSDGTIDFASVSFVK
jgi:peptide/nickel transport system substrate-binding protein